MEDHYLIAMDIGGTSYRVALADKHGNIINRKVEPTNSHESHQIGLARIGETIKEAISDVDIRQVKGIVVSAAGPMNPQTGVLLTPPSLPAWRNVPVKSFLEESFDLPVWVENDADLAALGEQRFGAGRGCSRLVYITISTGIGGGIVLDNDILRGSDVSVAEIGHMVVDPNGPVCNCGGKGHLEPLASGTALARIALEHIQAGYNSSLAELRNYDSIKFTAEAVVQAARSGDQLAIEVLLKAGHYLGMAITSLIHIFDPQVVVIGGGVANAGHLILKPIQMTIEECIMPDFRGRAYLTQSELGDNSGIMGAIAYGLNRLYSVKP